MEITLQRNMGKYVNEIAILREVVHLAIRFMYRYF